eukprot:TRINITY_DN72063_c0_g1_i1.p2 TRINITY_DN72063_c0_g1~~TRINITY_DN72063_c0_g1_i1.p2  ORF type:complete len:390 (+),score=59.08 TRINITY_DN72063_c0_g1_i1:216-1385(+)
MLSVAIDAISVRYQLSEADVRETFHRWGPLHMVQIHREGSREVGVVNFVESLDASDAQRQLNGLACNFDGHAGTLVVVPGPPEKLSQPGGGSVMGAVAKGGAAAPPPSLGDGKASGKGVNGVDANGRRNSMWSCKIVVQADQMHPLFPVAMKIAGVNNANVEHIRTHSGCFVQLRGRGSGYMEQETGRELQEPLALWLASENPDVGRSTCSLAQDLLKSVYEEHHQWCLQNGHGTPPPVEAQVILQPQEDGGNAGAAAPPGPLLQSPPAPAGGTLPPMLGSAPAPGLGAPGPCGPGPCGPGPCGPGPCGPGPCPATAMAPGGACPGMAPSGCLVGAPGLPAPGMCPGPASPGLVSAPPGPYGPCGGKSMGGMGGLPGGKGGFHPGGKPY